MTVPPAAARWIAGFLIDAGRQLQANPPLGETSAPTPPLAPYGRLRLSSKELSRALGVSTGTLSRWMRRCVIPYQQIGRRILFDLADVEIALRRFRRRAIGEPRRGRYG